MPWVYHADGLPTRSADTHRRHLTAQPQITAVERQSSLGGLRRLHPARAFAQARYNQLAAMRINAVLHNPCESNQEPVDSRIQDDRIVSQAKAKPR